MKRRMFLAVVLSFSAAAETSAQPTPETGLVTTYGLASSTCGDYLEARRLPTEAVTNEHGQFVSKSVVYREFIGGYLTSASIAANNKFPTSVAGIEGWLDNECKERPEEQFFVALSSYVGAHTRAVKHGVYRCAKANGEIEFTATAAAGCTVVVAP